MGKQAANRQLSGSNRTNAEVEASILKKLVESGEREKLRAKLNDYLSESSWRDDVKQLCKDTIRKNEDMTVDDLVQETAPRACDLVPHKVKKILLKDLQKFVEDQAADED